MSGLLFGPSPVVKRLLELKKGPDTTEDKFWAEKAVKSLVKKLKKSGGVEELEKAIATQDPNTKCVTIPRYMEDQSIQSVSQQVIQLVN